MADQRSQSMRAPSQSSRAPSQSQSQSLRPATQSLRPVSTLVAYSEENEEDDDAPSPPGYSSKAPSMSSKAPSMPTSQGRSQSIAAGPGSVQSLRAPSMRAQPSMRAKSSAAGFSKPLSMVAEDSESGHSATIKMPSNMDGSRMSSRMPSAMPGGTVRMPSQMDGSRMASRAASVQSSVMADADLPEIEATEAPTTEELNKMSSICIPRLNPPTTAKSILENENDVVMATKMMSLMDLDPREKTATLNWATEQLPKTSKCPEKWDWVRREAMGPDGKEVNGYQCEKGGHAITDGSLAEGKDCVFGLRTQKWSDWKAWEGPYYYCEVRGYHIMAGTGRDLSGSKFP